MREQRYLLNVDTFTRYVYGSETCERALQVSDDTPMDKDYVMYSVCNYMADHCCNVSAVDLPTFAENVSNKDIAQPPKVILDLPYIREDLITAALILRGLLIETIGDDWSSIKLVSVYGNLMIINATWRDNEYRNGSGREL